MLHQAGTLFLLNSFLPKVSGIRMAGTGTVDETEGEWDTKELKQGCHWTFAKITEKSTCACRLTENEHKKRQKVQKEKDEIGENREY